MTLLVAIILIIASYFLGNISPATFLAKAAGHNIKEEGSGNAGTTNVLRVLGKKAAFITFVIDVAKGFLAVTLGHLIMRSVSPFEGVAIMISGWCGLAAFIGHVWPVIHRFQGGKGVATALGTLLAFDWKMALICLGIFIIVAGISKMVSLGSISAAVAFVIIYYIRFIIFAGGDLAGMASFVAASKYILPFIIMVIILVYKHRENIERIRVREEKLIKFGPHGKVEFVDPEVPHE